MRTIADSKFGPSLLISRGAGDANSARTWHYLAKLTTSRLVELIDTGKTMLLDGTGNPALEIALDDIDWHEIVLAVARRVPVSSL